MRPTTEPSTSLTSASFEDLVQEMLVRLGEDPQREGLQLTPERVRKSMQFLTRGYSEDPETLLKGALFTVTYDEMVIVKECSACASITCCPSSARCTWPIFRTAK
jgi:GTP cyclohydrolase I